MTTKRQELKQQCVDLWNSLSVDVSRNDRHQTDVLQREQSNNLYRTPLVDAKGSSVRIEHRYCSFSWTDNSHMFLREYFPGPSFDHIYQGYIED